MPATAISPPIQLWLDPVDRTAAEQMAMDEALFRITEQEEISFARFYRWHRPAFTFGYFEKASSYAEGAVRRFTGGGLVEHGEDLTFLLTIPRSSKIFPEPAELRYRTIHDAIGRALHIAGLTVSRDSSSPSRATGPCFQNPVSEDLLDPATREKIGGGAQRRTRQGIIHQGSLRIPPPFHSLDSPWTAKFTDLLSGTTVPVFSEMVDRAEHEAVILSRNRYSSAAWNNKR